MLRLPLKERVDVIGAPLVTAGLTLALALQIAAGLAVAAAITVAIAFQRARFVPPDQQAVAVALADLS